MSVHFHANFGLNRERMAGLLQRGLADPTISDETLANPFGYKAEFSRRYRSWLHKTGPTHRERLPLTLTPMGEVVWRKDPALEGSSLGSQGVTAQPSCPNVPAVGQPFEGRVNGFPLKTRGNDGETVVAEQLPQGLS